MEYHIIASGSSGNCTLIFNNDTLLLIDMGISLTKLKEELLLLNKSFNDINGLLITHEHTDHIKPLKALNELKIYAYKNIYKWKNYKHINYYKSFKIGSFNIVPIKANHDSLFCMGFVIKDHNETLTYLTDTGCFVENNKSYCLDSTYYLIESNHDIKMLLATSRPPEVKERILSDDGHLCNEISACLIKELMGEHTKEVCLMHLSREANTKELALKAYEYIFKEFKLDLNKIDLKVSSQFESLHGGNNNGN